MDIKPLVRDQHGLLPGVEYILTEDGSGVDWRKMVKPEYLVPNKKVFEKRGQPVPTSIKDIEDKDLLILLQGIKDVCKLRGALSISQTITSPCRELVACACHIIWMANFETNNQVVSTAGTADATPNNTSGFGTQFLTTVAENRAFVRCVRNFLGIKVLGQEEINPQGDAVTDSDNIEAAKGPPDRLAPLVLLMKEKNVSFESIKAKLVAEKCEGAENFESISDLPGYKIFELLERLRKKKV